MYVLGAVGRARESERGGIGWKKQKERERKKEQRHRQGTVEDRTARTGVVDVTKAFVRFPPVI